MSKDKKNVEYTAIIESTKDGFYGYFPEINGCETVANTPEEVKENLSKCLEDYLRVLSTDGKEFPQPFCNGNRKTRAFEIGVRVRDHSVPSKYDFQLSYVAFAVPDIYGGYTVTAPDLPGLITYGENFKEARRNATGILKEFLKDIRANGEKIPPRHYEIYALEEYKVAVDLSDLLS